MQEDPNKPHRHNCTCATCQKLFGGLPLLAEAAEMKKKKESEQDKQLATPSTSRGLSDHHSRKPFECTYCKKTFSHKGDFNKHERTHRNEQPFDCSICGMKFSNTSNLARHKKSLHSDVKPYVCEKCMKNFSRVDKLKVHQKSCCKK